MKDVILVTADSVRRDFVDSMEYVGNSEVYTGIASGHYTRPSLAGLLSSQIRASIQSKVLSPTLTDVLKEANYSTIGLVPSPQTDPAFGFDSGFDFYNNFVSGSGNPVRNRRSKVRERLGSFDIVRQIYRRLYPMETNIADLPDDSEVIEEAIHRFNASDQPRFLWVHLMGSHRPYGVGDDAIPPRLDRKAEASGGRHWFGNETISPVEHSTIVNKYRNALKRVDVQIERLYKELDTENPIFAVTSDHGDELGEDGYYYHQGYRRRVADTIIRVPVVLHGVEPKGERLSLLDIPPTITNSIGLDAPDGWQGIDLTTGVRGETLTVAPWHSSATLCWQDFERKVIARNAEVTMIEDGLTVKTERTDVDPEIERQLRDLGYQDAG